MLVMLLTACATGCCCLVGHSVTEPVRTAGGPLGALLRDGADTNNVEWVLYLVYDI